MRAVGRRVRYGLGRPGSLAPAVIGALVLAACDTGDGTVLRDPAPDAPPPTDVPIATIDTAPADQIVGDTLASAPLATEPPAIDPEAPTLPATETGIGFEFLAPWADGGIIDARYGCDGFNATPPLAWNEVPDGTVELAVSLVDESDLSRGQPFVHWVMSGIDPASPGLAENEIPIGSVTALNFFGNVAYDGPCPDPGTTSVYRLTLHALNQQLETADGTPAAETLAAIELVTLDRRSVTGSSTR